MAWSAVSISVSSVLVVLFLSLTNFSVFYDGEYCSDNLAVQACLWCVVAIGLYPIETSVQFTDVIMHDVEFVRVG